MSVFSDLKPKNRASRNAFDLSRRSVFSTKVGTITPVFVQPTLPSSHYRLDVQQLLRSQTMQTAAFTGFSVNYDFVFVPYNHLYSSFNQFIAQRENKNLANQPSNQHIPSFDYSRFMDQLLPYAVYDYMMGQASYSGWCAALPKEPINYCLYCWIESSSMPNYSVALEVIRMLDMLGYGNFLPMVKQCADLFADFLSTVSFSGLEVSKYNEDYGLFVRDVSNWFDEATDGSDDPYQWWSSWLAKWNTFFHNGPFQPIFNFYGDNYIGDLKYPSLWPVLAYNKCFYEYYRNTYYDTQFTLYDYSQVMAQGGEYSWDYVQLFNYDDYGVGWDNAFFWRVLAMFAPKYHTYKRDLFTGVLPSTQFGDVSMMVSDDDWRKLLYTDVNMSDPSSSVVGRPGAYSSVAPLTSSGAGIASPSGSNNYSSARFKFDPSLAISVLESRRADAMQRFKERMMRAGDKTKDIFEAHGWSSPKSESAFEPVFLGSFDGRLDINAVASTTETEHIDLGQLAANGVSVVSGNTIDFDCSDFGLIICLMYIVKDSEVDAYGVERAWNLLEPFDFPYPELQNISLAPVVRGQLNAYGTPNRPQYVDEKYNSILGYLPRYMEYKTAVDKVHGEFFTSSPFAVETFENYNSVVPVVKGEFSSWVTPRALLFGATKKDFLYQSPSCADNVFYQAATSLQSTDQFFVNAYFRCHAVEPLSVVGLPI